jgi:hypothetical protein
MQKALLLICLTLILLSPASAQFFIDEQVKLFPFVVDGKWGFIDKNGTPAIEPKFKSVSGFREGFAVVQTFDDKAALIDRKGVFAFPPVEMTLYSMSDGMTRVRQGEKFGYLNKEGEIAIPLRFDEAGDFFNGVARVRLNRKFTFIDTKGKLLTKLYKKAYNFSEGLAIVEIDGKRGYIDLFDELVIKPVYDDSDGFSQGMAAVRVGSKYGFIDRSGAFAVEPKFDNARWFSDGMAPVEIGGKWGFIDHDGDFRIDPVYKKVQNFYDGMAAVEIDGKWGYINKKGKVIINPKYSMAGNFDLGVAGVENCTRTAPTEESEVCEFAYITKSGQILWDSRNSNPLALTLP